MRKLMKSPVKTFIALVISIGMSISGISLVSSATAVNAKISNIGASSISVTVTSSVASKVYVEYGYSKTKYSNKTLTFNIAKGGNSVINVDGLKAETKVYLRARYATGTKSTFSALPQLSATTGKMSDEYVFAIQADPHMDQASSADVYKATLSQIVKAKPSFMMDLGDIFMTDKLPDKSEANIRARFQLMKDFYGILGNIPYYFTLGNHDGELGYSNFNTKKYRKEYFPEQTPDLAYYSFTSPNSLHVVLDIFTKCSITGRKRESKVQRMGWFESRWVKWFFYESTGMGDAGSSIVGEKRR